MDDHAALTAAVCDRPDDDTPRLVFADWLDDHGRADHAAFVRTQVELARTPAWEPLAVLCRHRRPEWADRGEPFRDLLPAFPAGWSVGWAEPPFRRGFGYRVGVGSVLAWDEVAPGLFQRAPVGALHLRAAATLDDWKRFAAGPWLERVREVHLEAGSPVEPVRALAAGGRLTGLTGLHFGIATSPGLDTLLGDVLPGPLAATVRELTFRLGNPAALDDLMDVLADHAGRLDRLALRVMMGLSADPVRRWAAAGGLRNLHALDLTESYGLGNAGVRALADGLAGGWTGHTLVLTRVGMADAGAKALAGCPGLASIRLLDLSENPFSPPAARALAASPHLAGVRALRLRRCGLGDAAVRRLVRGTFWTNLTELDLRDNPVSDPGVRHLLAAPTPPELTALVLSARHLSGPARGALRRHFGERVVFTEE